MKKGRFPFCPDLRLPFSAITDAKRPAQATRELMGCVETRRQVHPERRLCDSRHDAGGKYWRLRRDGARIWEILLAIKIMNSLISVTHATAAVPPRKLKKIAIATRRDQVHTERQRTIPWCAETLFAGGMICEPTSTTTA